MQLDLSAALRRWLPFAAIATAGCLLVYAAVQQSLRTGANDPQVQIAEDAVRAVERGEPIESIIPGGTVDIERSLAPFLIAFDASGKAIAGSGTFRQGIPSPPNGVFEFVRANGEERVTWQPAGGTRIAAVVLRTSSGKAAFILAGRSLREVERRTQYTRDAAAIAWVAALASTLLLVMLGEVRLQRSR